MRYVYFARIVGTAGPIKIGCSTAPRGRCRQLGFDLAEEIELLASVPGDHTLERNLHLKFAKHRAPGPRRVGCVKPVGGSSEWFAPVPAILGLIETARNEGSITLPREDCRERIFADRYLAGETLKQIGDSCGLTRERVRQILRKAGVESLGWRDEHKRPPHVLTETELRAIELYQADVRPSEITRRTGLSVYEVAYARRLAGIPSKGVAHWLTLPNDAEITQQVCDLYLAGKSGLEIVAAVPHLKYHETVYRYLKKGGVKPHRGSRHNRATAQRSATA